MAATLAACLWMGLSTLASAATVPHKGDAVLRVSGAAGSTSGALLTKRLAERYLVEVTRVVKVEDERAALPGPVGASAYAVLPEPKKAQVPLPGAIWLFGSGLFGFVFLSNRKRV